MSVCLGLEWSSRRNSVALLDHGKVTEKFIMTNRFSAPEALCLVTEVLAEAGKSERDLTEIRIGRGPGNYSGIRQSIAYAIGLSAPDALPVRAVNSGALINIEQGTEDGPYWIMGDARRGKWWGAKFPSSNPEWRVMPPEDWKPILSTLPVYSAEAERLESLSAELQTPMAKNLVQLPDSALPESIEPLYVHQAV